jgi:tetratricopeptide (TPR) repeat protein/polysaccharide pyruvyl transferase WcaK-like protein
MTTSVTTSRVAGQLVAHEVLHAVYRELGGLESDLRGVIAYGHQLELTASLETVIRAISAFEECDPRFLKHLTRRFAQALLAGILRRKPTVREVVAAERELLAARDMRPFLDVMFNSHDARVRTLDIREETILNTLWLAVSQRAADHERRRTAATDRAYNIKRVMLCLLESFRSRELADRLRAVPDTLPPTQPLDADIEHVDRLFEKIAGRRSTRNELLSCSRWQADLGRLVPRLVGHSGIPREVDSIRVLIFGAYGNGNLGDAYQAIAVQRHLMACWGLEESQIFATSLLSSADYPFPAAQKLEASAILDAGAVNSFDCLLIGGGGLMEHPHGPLFTAAWVSSLHLPVGIIAIGATSGSAETHRLLLQKAWLVTGRDAGSVAALRRIRPDTHLLRDPVLCARDLSELTSFDGETAMSGTSPAIGKGVLWILKHPSNSEEKEFLRRVALHLNSDGKSHTVVAIEPRLDQVLTGQMPLPVRFISNLRDLMTAIEGCSTVVSMRYHGALLGAIANKVVYGYAQPKLRNLYDELGIHGCYGPSFEQLVEYLRAPPPDCADCPQIEDSRQDFAAKFQAMGAILLPNTVSRAVPTAGAIPSARVLANTCRLAASLRWMTRAFQVVPAMPDDENLHTSVLEHLGRVEEAWLAATRALELAPGDAELTAALNRIEAKFILGLRQTRDHHENTQTAIEAGLKLAYRNADDAGDWVALAQVLAKAQRLHEALAWVSRALDENHDCADYQRFHASLLERLERFPEALQSARRALQLAPDSAELIIDIERIETAHVCWLRQRRDDLQDPLAAIDAGWQLARREPPVIEDWVALARLLAEAGRLDEAVGLMSRALQIRPDAPDYLLLRAAMLERLGRYGEAFLSAQRALDFAPGDAGITAAASRVEASHLQSLRQRRDELQDPLAAIEIGLELATGDRPAIQDCVALANLFARSEQPREALQWARYALELAPGDAGLATNVELLDTAFSTWLRRRRDELNEPEMALEAGLSLAQRTNNCVADWVALAQMLAKCERLHEAVAWVSRALDKRPEVADYHRLHASLLERLERFPEALQSAGRALDLAPLNVELTTDVKRINAANTRRMRERRDESRDPRAAIEAGMELACHSSCAEDWAALAHLLAREERLAEALQWIHHAVQSEPLITTHQRLQASLLERLGRYREAYQCARRARGLDPADVELRADVRRTLKKLILRPMRLIASGSARRASAGSQSPTSYHR